MNACAYGRPYRFGERERVMWFGAPGTCADDWWSVSPGWARCAS